MKNINLNNLRPKKVSKTKLMRELEKAHSSILKLMEINKDMDYSRTEEINRAIEWYKKVKEIHGVK